jgi:outer membrane receptor for ferrienterochelin and colicins
MARAHRAVQLMAVALLLAAAVPAAGQTGAIAGRVSDAESGAGIAAAHVRAERADGVTAAVAQSDAEGRFRLNLQAGTYSVVVSNVGYAEVRQPNVAVVAGQTVMVNLALTVTAMLLPPVVVTPERGQQGWLTTAGPIEVVPMERVEERIAIQPTDFLRGIQGIDYVQTGLMTTTVVARGFSNVFSTSLLAITDNRYMNVPSLRVNAAFLMPSIGEDIEQIEVMLGPGAALYGPNAANGVMHILTQSPLRYLGTAISVTGGERSFFAGALRHAGQIGERFGYKLTGQYMQGREWAFIDQEEVDARAEDPSIPARDPDLSRWTAELRGDYRLTDAATLIVSLGRATAENAIEMTPFGAAQARGWAYSYAQARLCAGRLFPQGFVNMSDAGTTFLLRTGEPIVDESRLYAAQIQHSTPVGLRQNFTYGIDVQHTNPRTGGTIHGRFEDDDDSDEIGGYILSQTQLTPQLDLQLAARGEKTLSGTRLW